MNINTDILRNIATFLYQNEQYGDDWAEEIAELDKVIDCLDAKAGKFDIPSYDYILSTCLEELDEDGAYIVNLPLGYYIQFTVDASGFVWAAFHNSANICVKKFLLWKNDDTKIQKLCKQNFEYYVDHFFDEVI